MKMYREVRRDKNSLEFAQISMEYLAVMAFLLLASSALFLVSYDLTQKRIQADGLTGAVYDLENAVKEVQVLGPGSQKIVRLNLPNGILQDLIGNHEIGWSYQVYGSSAVGRAAVTVDVNVSGNLPVESGVYTVVIKLEDSGTVRVGSGLDIAPEKSVKNFVPGTNGSETFTLMNRSGETLNGFQASWENTIQPYVSLGANLPNSLGDGQDVNFSVNYSLPANVLPGTYSGLMTVTTSQNQTAFARIQLQALPVLGDVNVHVYNDPEYSVPDQNFFLGETVYFEVRTVDNFGNLISADLNTELRNQLNQVKDSEGNQSTLDGFYQSLFKLKCGDGSNGIWNVQATANTHGSITDRNSFGVQGSDQNNSITFDWNNATVSGGGKEIRDWKFGNGTECSNLIIKEIRVNWTNDASNRLEEIKLNNQNVWTGSIASGVWTDVTDFTVETTTEYANSNKLKFNKRIDDNGEVVTLEFKFTDETIYKTVGFP